MPFRVYPQDLEKTAKEIEEKLLHEPNGLKRREITLRANPVYHSSNYDPNRPKNYWFLITVNLRQKKTKRLWLAPISIEGLTPANPQHNYQLEEKPLLDAINELTKQKYAFDKAAAEKQVAKKILEGKKKLVLKKHDVDPDQLRALHLYIEARSELDAVDIELFRLPLELIPEVKALAQKAEQLRGEKNKNAS